MTIAVLLFTQFILAIQHNFTVTLSLAAKVAQHLGSTTLFQNKEQNCCLNCLLDCLRLLVNILKATFVIRMMMLLKGVSFIINSLLVK